MNDWTKIVTVLLLAATSFVAAYFLVIFLHPLFAVIAWLVLTLFLTSLTMYFFAVEGPLGLALSVVLSAIASAVMVWLLYDLVKVLTILVLGWLIFRFLVRNVAGEIEEEIRKAFD